jgi:hypothetical protein
MDPEIARHLHEQRLRDGRHRWPVPDQLTTRSSRASRRRGRLRRTVGRTIVRIGLAIEAEPRQPFASR